MSDTPPADPPFSLDVSRGFESWLAEQRCSIAFSTYQVGKIFFVGLKPDGRIWVFNRDVGRCLGLAVSGADLWSTGGGQIYRFVDAMAAARPVNGPDALYVPQTGYFTGDLDAHDVAVDADGSVIFVNTRFNCLATVSLTHSFRPLWRPPFISRLAAEDRCHLNGLALEKGRARYVTCVAQSDTFDGWRDHRANGGIVVDVDGGQTVCSGLSMPHSPRVHDARLWVLNSGTGELGWVDGTKGRFEPLCFCPGYLRGLAFVGEHFALVGLSKPRDKTFAGLPLDRTLEDRKIAPRCGIYVIDLRSGDILHSLSIGGIVTELYDVAVLPGVRQPSMVGLDSEEQKRTISVE
ncbi:MAG: TIGR03032 family protein [Rhizomicrobium sp.]